jgi:hypothetical protein
VDASHLLGVKGGDVAEPMTFAWPMSVGGKNKLSIIVSAFVFFLIFVELYFHSSEFPLGGS